MSTTPFTVLTGYLGVGKTTLLNRILANPNGNKIAVLVNELGRIAIDSDLIVSRGGDVLELAGGCVCCKIDVKNDLWDGIADVCRRSQPDHVILETTGIALPELLVEDLAAKSQDVVHVASVTCVVDGSMPETLSRRTEAIEQIKHADKFLLSKLDVASASATTSVRDTIANYWPDADVVSFPNTEEGSRMLVSWLLTPASHVAKTAKGHKHDHAHGQISAMVFQSEQALIPTLTLAEIERLGASLVRCKGYLFDTSGQYYFIEKAGNTCTITPVDARDDARNEIVLIGEGLDEASVRRRLWACQAGTE